jgi:hypothetical protein
MLKIDRQSRGISQLRGLFRRLSSVTQNLK